MATATPVELGSPAPITSAQLDAWAVTCLNCDSGLTGPFCSECGQRAVPPHPRVSELAGDAFAEFSGWDGKFAGTIRLLVRRPGELTRQFIAGRRVRYISPVRLYLALSFVYFVLAGAVPEKMPTAGDVDAGIINISAGSKPSTGAVAVGAAETAARRGTLTKAQRDSAVAQVARAPRILRPLLRRGIDDPNGLKRNLVANMPRVFFALVPVFAAILSLFYRKRHYPEHLYFVLHLNAFAFFALLFLTLARLSGVAILSGIVGPLTFVWICVYAVLALRRVYGGSLSRTLAKCVGIASLNLMASALALLALVFLAALMA
jgi:hypothetical protein